MIFQINELDLKVTYVAKVIHSVTTKDNSTADKQLVSYVSCIKRNENYTTTKTPNPFVITSKSKKDAMRFDTKEEAETFCQKVLDCQMIIMIPILPNGATAWDFHIEIVKLVSFEFEDDYPSSDISNDMDRDLSLSINILDKPTLIKDWNHLREVNPQSFTHDLEIEKYTGHIFNKDKSKSDRSYYLSTHTFYGMTHRCSTKTLRKCGFNVTVDNWDKAYPDRNIDSIKAGSDDVVEFEAHKTKPKVAIVGGPSLSHSMASLSDITASLGSMLIPDDKKGLYLFDEHYEKVKADKLLKEEKMEKLERVNNAQGSPFYSKKSRRGRKRR